MVQALIRTLMTMILLGSGTKLFSQDERAITINSFNDDSSVLEKKAFKYRVYTIGNVVFKDGSEVPARMNFNRLDGKMLFITPRPDTLVLAKPETTDKVIIGTDTFFFHNDNFLQQVSHYTSSNLLVRQELRILGREKKGPYGTYSGVSSANSNSTFTNDDQITNYLQTDENVIFKLTNYWFIADKFNNFFPATKKSFYKVFFNVEKQLRTYLDTHPINFNKKNDLLQLMAYVQTIP